MKMASTMSLINLFSIMKVLRMMQDVSVVEDNMGNEKPIWSENPRK